METLEEDRKTQLLKEKQDKEEIQQKLGEAQKQKEFLESTLKEDHEQFQREAERMKLELKLHEVWTML